MDKLSDLQLADTALWHVDNGMPAEGAKYLRALVDRMKRREPAAEAEGLSLDDLDRLHGLAENATEDWRRRWKRNEDDFAQQHLEAYSDLASRLHTLAYPQTEEPRDDG